MSCARTPGFDRCHKNILREKVRISDVGVELRIMAMVCKKAPQYRILLCIQMRDYNCYHPFCGGKNCSPIQPRHVAMKPRGGPTRFQITYA